MVALPVRTKSGYDIARLQRHSDDFDSSQPPLREYGPTKSAFFLPETLDDIVSWVSNDDNIHETDWYELAGNCSKYLLTFVEDKPEAISTITQSYPEKRELHPNDYEAGLWRDTLLRDLLLLRLPWAGLGEDDKDQYIIPDEDLGNQDLDRGQYAPSRSWVFVPYGVFLIPSNPQKTPLIGTTKVVGVDIQLSGPRFPLVQSSKEGFDSKGFYIVLHI
ncbi:Heterokaryon incompatibility protein 6, OR allele [Fusarium austroafricanum]|uniref:Heterokaryon incompatibility protein 6, OR allele n=1 Tax=Fusarium austroafricanum TaxID=2364996 RepID=A0A8H4K0D6_9HYPO|nr:Heterokaryon incompatibility protein 6, OR allele [Fusarium austroafricanum]